jgi:hypothetical protein
MSSSQSATPPTGALEYEPAEEHDEWLDEPEELPRRPRRRLLTPVPLALLAALLIACGFIGGVLIEKGQGGTASASAGASGAIASRLAGFKGAAPGAAGGAGGGTASAAGAGSKGGAGAFPGLGASAGGGVTTGEVAYVSGNTLYVTDSQGNTVKVNASAGSKVTKTVSTKAQSIRPGSTVVVLGSKAKNGSISATSITVGSAASPSATGSGASSAGAGASGGGATPTLFGPG